MHTQHHDDGASADGGYAVGGVARPGPVVVLAEGLEQERAVGQHREGGAGERPDLGDEGGESG